MRAIFQLPNLLSLARLPLALILCCENPFIRALVIVVAMLTDVLDGFLARRLQMTSRLGTLLDPLTDKLFVVFALGLFFVEDRISFFHIIVFLLRDISLLAFTVWLKVSRLQWTIRSFFCGKVMTACQFVVLFLLALGSSVPSELFILMTLFGVGSFFELVFRSLIQLREENHLSQ